MLGRLKFGFGEYIGMMFANDKFDVPLMAEVRPYEACWRIWWEQVVVWLVRLEELRCVI